MAATINNPAGGYRFVPGVFQYSAGVAALPGFRVERVRFAEPVPMAEGFRRVAALLDAARRPKAAFCACELRSPAPFTEDGFRAFNQDYAGVLAEWGVLVEGRNPVARSNVCPEVAPPAAPAFHAFAYTVPVGGPVGGPEGRPEGGPEGRPEGRPDGGPDAAVAPSFIVAGSGEATEGFANYRDHTEALGDLSPAGLYRKARKVLGEMERRLAALGAGWADTTGVQVYTVHDLHPFLAEEIVGRGAARHGLTWQFCRPPVIDLEFEMDCRGVALERVVAG